MVMRPSDTWVCVADARGAHFFRCDGPGRCLEPVLDFNSAGHAASQLDRAAADRLFTRLVLVAPAPALGELGSCLRPETRALVVGEIDRDLTRATPRQLQIHLQEMLPH
jgi:protein required for attachment to host cells